MSSATAGNPGRGGKAKQRGAQAAGATTCSSCGERNQASARFCQACGRSLTGGGWFNAQTLTVLATACVTLVVLGVLFASVLDFGSTSEDASAGTAPARTTTTAAGQPPDLSTMTPREAADRLFNRVMMADEQGDSGEVEQFAPMAVAAYDQLENLDLDGLYHVGLIHAAAGDIESAWEAVERLRVVVPEHLLASVLEHRLALAEGDQARAERAVEHFKAHYDQEIVIDRLEYRDHQRAIDQFRQQIGVISDGG